MNEVDVLSKPELVLELAAKQAVIDELQGALQVLGIEKSEHGGWYYITDGGEESVETVAEAAFGISRLVDKEMQATIRQQAETIQALREALEDISRAANQEYDPRDQMTMPECLLGWIGACADETLKASQP